MQTYQYRSFTCSIYHQWSYLIKAAYHTSHMFVFHNHSLLFVTNLRKDTYTTMVLCQAPQLYWSVKGPVRVFIKCQLHLFPSVLVIKTRGGSCLQKGAKSNEVNSLPGAEVGLSCRSYTYPQCTTA